VNSSTITGCRPGSPADDPLALDKPPAADPAAADPAAADPAPNHIADNARQPTTNNKAAIRITPAARKEVMTSPDNTTSTGQTGPSAQKRRPHIKPPPRAEYSMLAAAPATNQTERLNQRKFRPNFAFHPREITSS
jgi:hypothetical protein